MKDKEYKIILDELAEIFSSLSDKTKMKKLLVELFTPAELQDLALRWALLKLLKNNHTQREIASKLGISLCKITRGSKIIKNPNSAVNYILDSLEKTE